MAVPPVATMETAVPLASLDVCKVRESPRLWGDTLAKGDIRTRDMQWRNCFHPSCVIIHSTTRLEPVLSADTGT